MPKKTISRKKQKADAENLEWGNLKMKLASAEATFAGDETITPDEVLSEDEDTIADKVALAKSRQGIVRKTLSRFKECRSANDVFASFAMDAAKSHVLEMQLAFTSADRQRAADSILNRALGKPVDRVMSVGVQVSSKYEPELDHDIKRLLAELGYKDGQGAISALAPGGEGTPGCEPVKDLSPESRVEWRTGVSRKVYSVDG